MKKLLVALLSLTVVGGFAFADAAATAPVVTIGDWGRQVFVVGSLDNGNTYESLNASWGQNPRIVGLSISGHNDNAGFVITPCADNGTFGLTDSNKAWISPIAGLTFESGLNMETDTWRGASDFGSDDWLRFYGVTVGGNSSTFARLGEGGGFQTDLNYNKDGIGVWALLWNPTVSSNSTATTDFQNSLQIGASYTITGIATIKAQYLGSNLGTTFMAPSASAPIVNAALNISAVKGLYEEVGVVVPTKDVGYTYAVADDTGFTVAALTIHARVQAIGYDGNAGYASNLGLSGGAGVDYDLGNGIGASADYQYVSQQQLNKGYTSGTNALNGIGVYIKKSFSNGYLGVGFEYSTIGFANNQTGLTNGSSHWAIPVVASEWF